MTELSHAMSLLGIGAVTGFVIGAPLGPTGALCATLALEGRRRDAIVGALGSATGLAVWGAVTVLSSAWLEDWLLPWLPTLRFISGIALMGLAATLWRRQMTVGTEMPGAAESARGLASGRGVFSTTLGLILLNPSGFALIALIGDPVARVRAAPWEQVLWVPAGMAVASFGLFFWMIRTLDRRREGLAHRTRVRILRGFAVVVGLFGATATLTAFV